MVPTRQQRRRSSQPGGRRNSHPSPRTDDWSRTRSSTSSTSDTRCSQQNLSFQCLEKIALEVAVEEETHPNMPAKTRAVFYVLRVHHAACDVRWSHRLALSAYVDFQTRLLVLLAQGHACAGDCPWLYSFLQSYFPRASACRFKLLCPKRIARRREALALCLTTLHTFLLTRENQSCPVLRRDVLKAFTGFVYGELGPSHPLLSKIKVGEHSRQSPTESEGSSSVVSSPPSRASSGASCGGSADEEKNVVAVPTCALCRSRLDEEAAALSLPVHPLPPPSAPASSSSSSAGSGTGSRVRYYATRLRCGHEFHDECILVWLNQALSCPLCGQSELSPRSETQRRGSSAGSFSATEGVQDST